MLEHRGRCRDTREASALPKETMMEIGASVGAWEKGARNLKDDVVTVQLCEED